MQQAIEYFNNTFAAKVWADKYALKDKNENLIEHTPTEMFKRLAKELARIEYKYYKQGKRKYSFLSAKKKALIPDEMKKEFKSNLNEQYFRDKIFELLDRFKYIIPGGSVMASLGTNTANSISNCFVLGQPNDSYNSINKFRTLQADLMKRRGGVGKDLSLLRPRGAKVNNSAKYSTGAVSFMSVDSEITRETAQENRRGALMLTLDIRHPDSPEFATCKRDLTKITGANISLKVTNDFMQAVEEDSEYTLRYPVDADLTKLYVEYFKISKEKGLETFEHPLTRDVIYTRKVKAKELWATIVKSNWLSAEPGILFMDNILNSPDSVYNEYRPVSTNPCQPSWATVLTKDGIRTFADINIGDEIWSSEGWTTIVNKQSSGIKNVYEYKTTAGSFNGTDTHRIISKGIKVEAKDAETIDVLAGYNNLLKDVNLQDVMDGLVVGDGSTHKASNTLVYLCIGENDTDYFQSEIKDLIGVNRESYEITTTITPKELPLTYLRTIPERFFKGNDKKVKGFLKGLYSANGSVVHKRVTLKTSSEKLRDAVQLMLSSIGIRSYYTTNNAKDVEFSNGTYTCKESYDINISTDREIFYYQVGFLQQYKMNALFESLDKIKPSDKTHNIISSDWISNEEVFNITVDNKSHTYWTGGLNVSNCGEIALGELDSCRLIHLNLLSFVKNLYTRFAYFNEDLFKEYTIWISRLADDIIDLEIEALIRIKKKLRWEAINSKGTSKWDNLDEIRMINTLIKHAERGRRCGIGFTAYADTMAALGRNYHDDFPEFKKLEYELDAQIALSITRGSFKDWDKHKEFTNFPIGNNDFYSSLSPHYKELLYKYGRRNISFSTCAPTGTISILTDTSSGIEPIFLPYYYRKKKVVGDEEYDFVDATGDKFITTLVVHKGIIEWAKVNNHPYENLTLEEVQKLYELSPYFNNAAQDIPFDKRLAVQGRLQKHISHSISSTINLPKDTTEDIISDIYIKANDIKLKGVTVYRDGCRDGVLTSTDSKQDNFVQHDAPKRGDILKAHSYIVTVKGVKQAVFVGLMEDKPYEIFAIDCPPIFTKQEGTITKVKRKVYKWEGANGEIVENIALPTDSPEEKAYTLTLSMLLRSGAKLPFIMKTIKKANPLITSFASALGRVLAKYNKEIVKGVKKEVCPDCGEELIREGGCVRCNSCTYSVCLLLVKH